MSFENVNRMPTSEASAPPFLTKSAFFCPVNVDFLLAASTSGPPAVSACRMVTVPGLNVLPPICTFGENLAFLALQYDSADVNGRALPLYVTFPETLPVEPTVNLRYAAGSPASPGRAVP